MEKTDNQPSFYIPSAFRAARAGLPDEVVIIARWDDEQSRYITIQDFIQNGRSFIPVFSDIQTFDKEIKGSGFEDQGVCINTDLLFSILRGGSYLIFNPGGENPTSLELPEL